MPRKTMPLMGVRRFRDEFPNLHKAVRVMRSTRKGDRPAEVLGVWTPEVRDVREAPDADGGGSDNRAA
jgi:hypothetical protein